MTAVFSVVTSTSTAYSTISEENQEAVDSGELAENEEDNTFDVECWNGELVDDESDCPVDEGNIVCNDGSFAVRISDCPTGSSPPEDDGDRDNNGIQDYAEEEDYVPLPYCDLVSDEYMESGGTCHDRKDYYQGGQNDGLYPCNDGTDKEDWRDCKDVSGFDYN